MQKGLSKDKYEKLKYYIASYVYPEYISPNKNDLKKCESPDFINVTEKIGLEITTSDSQKYCEWNGKRNKPDVFTETDSLGQIFSAFNKKCEKLKSQSYKNNIKTHNLEKMFIYISNSFRTCIADDSDSIDSLLEEILSDFQFYKKYHEYTFDVLFVELWIGDINIYKLINNYKVNISTKNLVCFDLNKNEVLWKKEDIQTYEANKLNEIYKKKK